MIEQEWEFFCEYKTLKTCPSMKKTTKEHCLDIISVYKNAVIIPGISMTYAMSKYLRKEKKLGLYTPGGICQVCCLNEKKNRTVKNVN